MLVKLEHSTRNYEVQKGNVNSLDFTSVYRQNRDRAITRCNTRQVIPTTNDTTTVLLNQVSEGNTHLLFDGARVVDMARDAEELGTLIALPTERREPRTAASADSGRNGHSLHISDSRGAAKEADIGGEGRL